MKNVHVRTSGVSGGWVELTPFRDARPNPLGRWCSPYHPKPKRPPGGCREADVTLAARLSEAAEPGVVRPPRVATSELRCRAPGDSSGRRLFTRRSTKATVAWPHNPFYHSPLQPPLTSRDPRSAVRTVDGGLGAGEHPVDEARHAVDAGVAHALVVHLAQHLRGRCGGRPEFIAAVGKRRRRQRRPRCVA
jgi:hypothetical protein